MKTIAFVPVKLNDQIFLKTIVEVDGCSLLWTEKDETLDLDGLRQEVA